MTNPRKVTSHDVVCMMNLNNPRFTLLRTLVIVGVLVAALPGAGPAPRLAQATEINRLVATARLWGAVRYFHPSLVEHSDIDWDKALVDAIPRIEAATTRAEFASAIRYMLSALRDPSTRLTGDEPVIKDVAGPLFEVSSRDGIAILALKNSALTEDYTGAFTALNSFAASTASAKGIVRYCWRNVIEHR